MEIEVVMPSFLTLCMIMATQEEIVSVTCLSTQSMHSNVHLHALVVYFLSICHV